MAKLKKKSKVCQGCCDHFSTFKNYDYCVDCAVNGSRYISKSNCPECDGSGMIKFPHQKPRPCKLCYLTKNPMNKKTKEEKFWEEVDHLAQEKIYRLLTRNIPLSNLKLITEPWTYEDKQNKLSGLFLHKDADYRALLDDTESQWYERVQEEGEKLPDKEYLAEEIAMFYSAMVMKSLIQELSDYACYEPSVFTNLEN